MSKNIRKMPRIGTVLVAADGGNYGVLVVGHLPEVDDVIVMPTDGNGKVIYSESNGPSEPRRIDRYKLNYRYMPIKKTEAA